MRLGDARYLAGCPVEGRDHAFLIYRNYPMIDVVENGFELLCFLGFDAPDFQEPVSLLQSRFDVLLAGFKKDSRETVFVGKGLGHRSAKQHLNRIFRLHATAHIGLGFGTVVDFVDFQIDI